MTPREGAGPLKPILILTTMVREESRTLPRLLRSAAGVVDHVALTDTGSRDDTLAVAEAIGGSRTA
jgi:hypothetical protein